MLKKQAAAELMKHLVTHDWHGYSQISRWGDPPMDSYKISRTGNL